MLKLLGGAIGSNRRSRTQNQRAYCQRADKNLRKTICATRTRTINTVAENEVFQAHAKAAFKRGSEKFIQISCRECASVPRSQKARVSHFPQSGPETGRSLHRKTGLKTTAWRHVRFPPRSPTDEKDIRVLSVQIAGRVCGPAGLTVYGWSWVSNP